jgi:Flp pilus assembly protein TadG
MSRIKKERRGQAMVEFALVAPVFFLLLFAIIEGGRFVFYYEMLNGATREGARYAIIHGSNAADGCPSGPPATGSTSCDPTAAKVKEAVRKAALGLAGTGDFSALDVFYCPAAAPKPCGADELTNARGNPVTVRAAYSYRPVMPLLPHITIGSESTLVINN